MRARRPRVRTARVHPHGASSVTTAQTQQAPDGAFRHEAYFYAGSDAFVDGMSAFVGDGIAAGDPTLVVVGAPKIRLLREALGRDAKSVLFADMADVGANPARIIPAWRDFVAAHAAGRALRGIGEPVHPGRGPSEMVECHRHEALLNIAFAGTPAFWLVCPYDTDALDREVVEAARRTHPAVVEDGVARDSALFDGPDSAAAPFADALPDPPADAAEHEVHIDALFAIRVFVRGQAVCAGLGADRTRDLLVAVNEVATNTVRHGGGAGRLLVWQEPGALVAEVRDRGRITDPLAGRARPEKNQLGGYGLWLANQLCDLVQVRAYATGGAVRLHMRRG
jgi:anti-sigma regulatory factor (Ser/Thr protein kinase)